MGAGVADNVLETGVSPGGRLDPPSWPPRRSRSSELKERPGHGRNPSFLCPTGMSGTNGFRPLHRSVSDP